MTVIGTNRNLHSGAIYCALLYLWSGQLNAGSHKQPAVLVPYTKPLVSWNNRKQHINNRQIKQKNEQTHIIKKNNSYFAYLGLKGVWVGSTQNRVPLSDSSVTVSSVQLTAWIFSRHFTCSVSTQATETQQVAMDQWSKQEYLNLNLRKNEWSTCVTQRQKHQADAHSVFLWIFSRLCSHPREWWMPLHRFWQRRSHCDLLTDQRCGNGGLKSEPGLLLGCLSTESPADCPLPTKTFCWSDSERPGPDLYDSALSGRNET